MKFLTIVTASNAIFFIASAISVVAAEGTMLRMQCGAAGIVTARLGAQITYGEPYYYTNIYSSGLNVGAKNLRGEPGASHFVVNDQGYSFAYFPGSIGVPNQTYSFSRYGKEYPCKPMR